MTLPSEKYDAHIVQEPEKRRPKWSESKTPYGYAIDEALSAMIKEMRRSKNGKDQFAFNAMYWAHQLAISGSRAEKFMWEALMTFAVEDIGPANPEVLTNVLSCKQGYEQFEHGYDAKYLFVANAVTICAASMKTRHVTNKFLLMLYRLRQGNEDAPEIPDYAFDFHLKKGKKMGRDLMHYFGCSSFVENKSVSWESHPCKELLKRSGCK